MYYLMVRIDIWMNLTCLLKPKKVLFIHEYGCFFLGGVVIFFLSKGYSFYFHKFGWFAERNYARKFSFLFSHYLTFLMRINEISIFAPRNIYTIIIIIPSPPPKKMVMVPTPNQTKSNFLFLVLRRQEVLVSSVSLFISSAIPLFLFSPSSHKNCKKADVLNFTSKSSVNYF